MAERTIVQMIKEMLDQTPDLLPESERLVFAQKIYGGIEEELGIFEDVYENLTDMLEPHVIRDPLSDRRTFPASLVGSFTMLLDHWKATGKPEIASVPEPRVASWLPIDSLVDDAPSYLFHDPALIDLDYCPEGVVEGQRNPDTNEWEAAVWCGSCDEHHFKTINPTHWMSIPTRPGVEDPTSFQSRTHDWLLACFGQEISSDKVERNHRFLEEALELVQASGTTIEEAYRLVDYVYSRPVGEAHQEVGGVLLTLAALCSAHGLSMIDCGETELARVWTKVEIIRAKQAAKPKNSPLAEDMGGQVWPPHTQEALAYLFTAIDREPELADVDEAASPVQFGRSFIAALVNWHLEMSGFNRLPAAQLVGLSKAINARSRKLPSHLIR
jgi:hypothetical protein